MKFDIIPATGQLVAVQRHLPISGVSVGILGNGEFITYNTSEAFSHDAMCGVFSRDPFIAITDRTISRRKPIPRIAPNVYRAPIFPILT